MAYVAGKTIKVVRDGQTIELQPGAPVPECTSWSTFKACLNTGHIVWQPLGKDEKPPKGFPIHASTKSDADEDDEDDKVRVAPIVAAKPPKRAKIQKEKRA